MHVLFDGDPDVNFHLWCRPVQGLDADPSPDPCLGVVIFLSMFVLTK